MAIELALLLVAVAVPGLLWRRHASRLARGCAMLAMAGVGLAVLDLPREILALLPPQVVVAPTCDIDPEAEAELLRALGGMVDVGFESGSASAGVADRLTRARLRSRRDPHLVTICTGRVAPSPRGGGAVAHGDPLRFVVLSARAVAPLDPDALAVRASTVAAAGRPVVLEVLLGAAARGVEGLRGRLSVRDPGGAAVLDQALSGLPTERVDWRPLVPGPHAVELQLEAGAGDRRVTWRGGGLVEVAPRPVVTVVGRRAAGLQRALEVQDLEVRTFARLPDDLPPTSPLVLLDPLSAADQARVAEFVGAGGGVLLVGAAGGGALPDRSEPLGAIAPVIRLPLPPVAETDRGKPGGEAPAGPDPRVEQPPEKPDPDPDPSPPPDGKARGDTSGARTKIEEREVERRRIAMVMVIDRSGSMLDVVEERGPGGRPLTKMDLAKASALHTARALDAGDELAVVSFGSGSDVVLPLSPVQHPAEIERKLEGLRARARETTEVHTALDAARLMLKSSDAAVKHVVIVTDGAIHDAGTFSKRALLAALKFVVDETGVTLSVVLAAPIKQLEAGTLTDARRLAAMGNGVDPDVEPGAAGRFFFQLESFDRVPRLLSTEVESLRTKAGRHRRPDGPTDPAAGQPPVDPPADPKTGPPPDDPPDPVPPAPPTPPPGFPPAQPLLAVHAILDSELLAPADDQGYPGVAGLLPVEARADGLALLAVEDGTPLLVFANRGLGRVGAWTADLLGPWGAAWVADPHFPARLAQWVRFLVPAQSAPAAVEVVEQVEVMPASVPLPREVAVWQELGGSDVRPLDSFVPPGATVETTVVGRAGDHAILGVLLLLILATAEFVRWRRPTSTP